MMKPFGMSGAYSMTVPTPNVLRITTGAEALGPVRKASMPVTDANSLVRNASNFCPVATSLTISAFCERFEFVVFVRLEVKRTTHDVCDRC